MSLEEFKFSLTAENAISVNRKTDACDWFFNGIYVFHNRTYWGTNRNYNKKSLADIFHGVFQETRDSYWGNVTYTDKKLAEKEAKEFGGEVEEEFYCDEDNKTWFIIFDDFDNAARYTYKRLKKDGKII